MAVRRLGLHKVSGHPDWQSQPAASLRGIIDSLNQPKDNRKLTYLVNYLNQSALIYQPNV